MKDNVSPEEKLLHLIRGPKKAEKNFRKPFLRTQKYPAYEKARKGLLIVFIASSAYLLISLCYPFFAPKNSTLPKIAPSNNKEEKILPAKAAKPYEYYSEAINNKQIFSGQPAQSEQNNPAILTGNDFLKDMNLVGIVNGNNPQAIIEDKKMQKTYYVSKNQIIGQCMIEDIQDGKVILDYNGQKYELYL